MAIDIVARALAVSGKQNLENYYTKTESDSRYVHSTTELYRVYIRDDVIDTTASYAYIPKAGAFPRYDTESQLQSAAPTDDLDVVNRQYGEGNYYQVTKGTDIPENADLNNYTTPGTYQAPNDATGETIKNTPYKFAFKLIVENFAYYKVQRVQGQGSDELWQRTYTNNGWTNWVQIATTSYVDNKTAVLIDNSLLGA